MMPYNPERHHRRSIRLQGFDYSQPGVYVITIVTAYRAHIFGEIINAQMHLSDFGTIANDEWEKSAILRTEIELDAWIVMPNHMHAIVVLTDPAAGANGTMHRIDVRPGPISTDVIPSNPSEIPPHGTTNKSLASLVQGYKSAVTSQIRTLSNLPDFEVWQRNYHDRIIRSEHEYHRFREYILNDPLHWHRDPYA